MAWKSWHNSGKPPFSKDHFQTKIGFKTTFPSLPTFSKSFPPLKTSFLTILSKKDFRDKIDQTLEYDRRRGHDNLHVPTRPSNDAWQTARANLDPYLEPYFTFFKAFLTSEKFFFYFTVERGPKSTYCKKPLVSTFSGSLHLGGRSAVGRTEPRIQIIN